MRRVLTILSLLILFGRSIGAAAPIEASDLSSIVKHTLDRSPDINLARTELMGSELAEPLFLSELDTQIEGEYNKTDDQAPRVVPAFEGTRSQLERFNVDLSQKTLLGTEARLSWTNQRLINPAMFRVLDPSAESILSFGIKQNLVRYLWGRPDVSRRKRYRSSVVAARERLMQQATDIAATTSRAVLDLQFATQRIQISQEAIANAKKLVQINDKKKQYGLVEDSDLLQASASLEAEETEHLLAQSSLRNAEHAFKQLVGQDFEISVSTEHIPALEPASYVSSLDSSLAKAMATRGDIKSLEASVEAAEWAARSEVLETLPEVSLNASYGVAGLDQSYSGAWDDLDSFDHPVKSIGVQVMTPLTYRKEKLLRQSKNLELEMAKQALQKTQERAEREVRDAWENLQLNIERLKARERLVQLHRKKYIAEKANFQRGRSSTDLLVRFQQEIHVAELAYARAENEMAYAEIELARSTNTLLPRLGVTDIP